MSVRVRNYNKNDKNMVNELIRTCFNMDSHLSTLSVNQKAIVAVIEDTVVGFALITRISDPVTLKKHCLVDYVCVSPDFQGNGIGRTLMEQVSAFARVEKYSYIELSSSRFRVVAHGLYNSMGYKVRESDIFRKVLE